MIRFLILMMLFSTPAFAGISTCYNPDNTLKSYSLRGPSIGGCDYYDSGQNVTSAKYDSIRTLLKTVPVKYIKKLNGDPVEMSSLEKVAVDDALAQQLDDEERSRIDRLEVTVNDVITALVKRINVRIPSNPITRAEVIQQIKEDKNL